MLSSLVNSFIMDYNKSQISEASKKAFPLHFFLRSLTNMRWLVLILLFTGCISRTPLFSIQRDDNPLNIPAGSVGVIPPVLQNLQGLNTGTVMTSDHFSLFGVMSPISQNTLSGNEFRMTTSTLAIGAQNLKGLQPNP